MSVSFVDEHRLYNWMMPNLLPYQCFESKKGGMLGRIRQQECDPNEACIRATSKEIRTWMEDNPLISDLIMKITRDSKAFQCHCDKFD